MKSCFYFLLLSQINCFLPLSPLCSVGPAISFLDITVPLTGILPACSPPPQWSAPVPIHCPTKVFPRV